MSSFSTSGTHNEHGFHDLAQKPAAKRVCKRLIHKEQGKATSIARKRMFLGPRTIRFCAPPVP